MSVLDAVSLAFSDQCKSNSWNTMFCCIELTLALTKLVQYAKRSNGNLAGPHRVSREENNHPPLVSPPDTRIHFLKQTTLTDSTKGFVMPKVNTSIRTSNGPSPVGRRPPARVSPYPSRTETHSRQAMVSSRRRSDEKDTCVNPALSDGSESEEMVIATTETSQIKTEIAFNAWESDDEDMFVDPVESDDEDMFVDPGESDDDDMFVDSVKSDAVSRNGRMIPMIVLEDEKEVLEGTPEDRLNLNDVSGFFKLPREVRDQIYGYVADGREEDTEYVCKQSDKYRDARLPPVPPLLQVSRRTRAEYLPVYVSKTEFVLGLASVDSLKIVNRWLNFIKPEITELTKMSFILRKCDWNRKNFVPHPEDRPRPRWSIWAECYAHTSDMDDHPDSHYSGWAEYWVDFKQEVADGNLIQVVQKDLYYHETTSGAIQNELALFKQQAAPMFLKRKDETLALEDIQNLINALLEMHGNYVVKEYEISRWYFGSW
ncbi:hypothetical protein BU16DRAFT_585971 [Lophium mytilinum]|uniref:F-box domain-containing protein n=1 Tax=Lophium mytilinum TaxID=390894 RepID=A0A6A6QCE1_9PEZI|nr:hypothetical protein BU16DRAFT_585971 [Lophium mytilinum]